MSANIGDDTDSVGAVVGSLAGIYYGIESIPKSGLINYKIKIFYMN